MISRQLFRFAVAGVFVTALAAALYWLLTTWMGINAFLANLFGYAVAVVVGFSIHSAWSFEGHGAADTRLTLFIRYVAGSLMGLLLNSFWVWLLVTLLRAPTWMPIIGMVFVTPGASFYLNKKWVFK